MNDYTEKYQIMNQIFNEEQRLERNNKFNQEIADMKLIKAVYLKNNDKVKLLL